jgi:hypothetical protein
VLWTGSGRLWTIDGAELTVRELTIRGTSSVSSGLRVQNGATVTIEDVTDGEPLFLRQRRGDPGDRGLDRRHRGQPTPEQHSPKVSAVQSPLLIMTRVLFWKT